MGNVYRGLNKTDCSVPPSIPAKYQRLVVRSPEKKGFSSQAKRFTSQGCLNEIPGPGSYDCVSGAELESPSFSKKGTTGFIVSKAARPSSYPQRGIPGPNVYNLQGSFINRWDFNTGVSRVFRLPVAVQLEGPKHKTPAPNQYDVHYISRERHFSTAGTSPFLSRTGRNSFCTNIDVPSPCHYNVSSYQLGSKAVLSPFKSKTQRIPPVFDNHVPGPGAYSPHQTPAPVRKTILPRRYHLAISAPPLIVPKDPPLPGPGQYDIRASDDLPKRHMPTAAFASRTERIPQGSEAEMRPGPGFYDPQMVSKRSFFYNDSRVWVPV
ncbi:O(6)-methylguanine-induced apoptosis 2 [Aulostomus maculatus]